MDGKLLLITSDISGELKQLIENGIVSASIFQNQYEQGRLGLHRLHQVLDGAEEAEDTISIDPQIILRSNLTLF